MTTRTVSPNLPHAAGLALALLASSSVAGVAACNVTDGSLLGSWEATGKGAAFEQLAFEREGSTREFNSWRHERPEISQAQWQLQDCQLTIRDPATFTEKFFVLLQGKQLVLSRTDGKPAGTFRRIEEKRAVATELRTPTYLVRITENCPEGEAGCQDVRYEGRNIKTGSSITLTGQAVVRLCADRVTPCSREGHRFRSGKVEYRVTPDGLLRVTQGDKVLVEEQGEWQTAATQKDAASEPVLQGVGVQVGSDYASARAKLLAASWNPDATYGVSGTFGKLAYPQYAEVVCGEGRDAVCGGRFVKAGQAILLSLDPNKKPLRVTSIDRD
jgi:hypothetical protein